MSVSAESNEVDPLDLVLEGKQVRRSWRAMPNLLRQSLDLVWAASRRDFLLALVLQLAPGVLIGVQVLLTRNALSALLKVDRDGARSSTSSRPWFCSR